MLNDPKVMSSLEDLCNSLNTVAKNSINTALVLIEATQKEKEPSLLLVQAALEIGVAANSRAGALIEVLAVMNSNEPMPALQLTSLAKNLRLATMENAQQLIGANAKMLTTIAMRKAEFKILPFDVLEKIVQNLENRGRGNES